MALLDESFPAFLYIYTQREVEEESYLTGLSFFVFGFSGR